MKTSTIVFDLDGTLYQDTHHFTYYAQRVKSHLPEQIQPMFQQDYQAVVDGRHPLKPGRTYDSLEDKVIVQVDEKVIEAYHWNGNRVSEEELHQLYPGPVAIDLKRFFSIGDLWGAPPCIGRHYGLNTEHFRQAFLETRDYMVSEDFVMNPVPNFKEALVELKKKYNMVLLTNSPQPDSEIIIKKIGLDQAFHKFIFSAKKPLQTKDRFKEIAKYFDANFTEILSIGDNYVNEIIPAKDLGMSTIYIDSHGTGLKTKADIVVESIEELIPHLKEL